MKISELKKLLPVGKEFVVEFIGINRKLCLPGMELTKRVVHQNNSQLVSQFLEGPKINQLIYMSWKGIEASERDGSIFLSGTDSGGDFLRIQIL